MVSTVTALRETVPPLRGRALVEEVAETGATRDGNPELELRLTVDLPGREPYEAIVRQVLSRQVVHMLTPGLAVRITADAGDPSRLEIG